MQFDGWEIPDQLYYLLRTGPCHCTSFENLQGILESGHIEPNRSEKHPFSTGRSKDSFANRNNLVSLFDFDRAKKEEIEQQIKHFWRFFFCIFTPVTIVIFIERDDIQNTFIPHKPILEAQKQAHQKLGLFIPHVEVWSSESIPVSAIQGYAAVWNNMTFSSFSDKDNLVLYVEKKLGQLDNGDVL